MKLTEISYSTLVTADNVSAHLKRIVPKITKTVRTKSLEPYKLEFNCLMDMSKLMDQLIVKIEQLEPGTLFSVGSLVISNTKTNAQVLGRELNRVELTMSCFRFMSAYSGKNVYERLKIKQDLVKDFKVQLKL